MADDEYVYDEATGEWRPAGDAHAAGEARVVRDAAGTPLADCYLGVDDAPAPLHEVVGWLREQLGVSHWAEQSSVRRAGSKRCSNARARALGWVPQYPSYREGYAAVLADAQSSLRPS